MTIALDETDRAIVNALQGDFPLSPRPFADAAASLGTSEADLIARLRRMVESGALSRFGPLWNAEAMGGAVCLCAMAVPPKRYDEVVDLVNAHVEVAHNYERAHALNMWFVLSAAQPERIHEVIGEIEAETGVRVLPMPKSREFFVEFKVAV